MLSSHFHKYAYKISERIFPHPVSEPGSASDFIEPFFFDNDLDMHAYIKGILGIFDVSIRENRETRIDF